MGKGRLPVTGIIAKNSVVAAGFPVNGSLLANEEVDLVAEIVGKVLTSSLRTPKFFVKEFSYFLMPCHQHGLRINLLVQR